MLAYLAVSGLVLTRYKYLYKLFVYICSCHALMPSRINAAKHGLSEILKSQ